MGHTESWCRVAVKKSHMRNWYFSTKQVDGLYYDTLISLIMRRRRLEEVKQQQWNERIHTRWVGRWAKDSTRDVFAGLRRPNVDAQSGSQRRRLVMVLY